ncbi:MAG: hypothetical protein RIR77_1115 [Planctomycetota bacterium]
MPEHGFVANDGDARNDWLLRKECSDGRHRARIGTLKQFGPRRFRPSRVRLQNARGVPGPQPAAGKNHVNTGAPLAHPARDAFKFTRTFAGQRPKRVIGPLLRVTIGGLGMTNDEEFHGFMVLSSPMVNESIAIENARIVSCVPPAGGGALRGGAMGALRVIERGHVIVENGRIAAVGAGPAVTRAVSARIDARGRVLMPAAVDCHTHACWAGERWGEWEQKRAGASYLEILKAGGGILSTVKAVRAASRDALASQLAERLAEMRAVGTGAVEVKTGYGLDAETELKMLEAILDVRAVWPAPIVATLLLGHALDSENPAQVADMCALLERVAQRVPNAAVDAYCEEGAWNVAMCRTLFAKARQLGMPVRVHADQFNAIGALELALEFGARSVDHLEASTASGIAALAASSSIGVVLPVCGFALDGRFADGRKLIDQGGALAAASNWNPGSAPSPSVQFAAALAAKHMRLTAAETICAVTYNAACVLGLEGSTGSIGVGLRADLQLLTHRDERAYAHEVAGPGPDLTILGGDLSVRVA